MQELGQFQNAAAAFAAAGVEICAVAVDPPEKLAEAKRKSKAAFPFAQDRDGLLLDRFGLRHVGGHPMKDADIARPALILIGRNGRVLWMDRVENYRARPTPEAVLEAAQRAFEGAIDSPK